MTRQTSGGFEPRFIVTRTDGKPCRPEARYIVLDYAGDPHARVAISEYARSIEAENPQMAADLRDALDHPERWPAQHRNAPRSGPATWQEHELYRAGQEPKKGPSHD